MKEYCASICMSHARLLMQSIGRYLTWPFQMTSAMRSGVTAHARNCAVDFAFRSGYLYMRRLSGICPMYHKSLKLVSAINAVVPQFLEVHPDTPVHIVCIERDHIHIECESLSTEQIIVCTYLPQLNNGLCSTPEEQGTILSQFRKK